MLRTMVMMWPAMVIRPGLLITFSVTTPGSCATKLVAAWVALIRVAFSLYTGDSLLAGLEALQDSGQLMHCELATCSFERACRLRAFESLWSAKVRHNIQRTSTCKTTKTRQTFLEIAKQGPIKGSLSSSHCTFHNTPVGKSSSLGLPRHTLLLSQQLKVSSETSLRH